MKISDFPFRGSISLPISQSVLEEQSCLPSKPPNKNVIALLRVSFSFGIAPAPTLPFKNQIFVIISIREICQTHLILRQSLLGRHSIKAEVDKSSDEIDINN